MSVSHIHVCVYVINMCDYIHNCVCLMNLTLCCCSCNIFQSKDTCEKIGAILAIIRAGNKSQYDEFRQTVQDTNQLGVLELLPEDVIFDNGLSNVSLLCFLSCSSLKKSLFLKTKVKKNLLGSFSKCWYSKG